MARLEFSHFFVIIFFVGLNEARNKPPLIVSDDSVRQRYKAAADKSKLGISINPVQKTSVYVETCHTSGDTGTPALYLRLKQLVLKEYLR
ncbi:hypothetical protein WA026_016093 [Henosepilachna vigintioctopunctata]|uniref:Uncharacterized protein n=1 Tax=Henosepilachna vigintioctopunctata TaxID=420089 RepID=A0AAW1U9Y9_9CUCU